jgi:hypothetical protein
MVPGLLSFPGIVALAAFAGAIERRDAAAHHWFSAFKTAARIVNIRARVQRNHRRRSTYRCLAPAGAAPPLGQPGQAAEKVTREEAGKISGTW